MSKFNVFDDWGNKVGEFIPSGEDGAGLFGCLFIVVLFVVGLPLYFLGWLIDKGFAAAKEGNKEEALLYWALPITLVVCLGGILLNSAASEAAQKQQFQQQQEEELRATQAEATRIVQLKEELPSLVQIGNAHREKCGDVIESAWCGDPDGTVIVFTVTNNYNRSISLDRLSRIYLLTPGESGLKHFTELWDALTPAEVIDPGQTREYMAQDKKSGFVLCLQFAESETFYHFSYLTTCAPIPPLPSE